MATKKRGVRLDAEHIVPIGEPNQKLSYEQMRVFGISNDSGAVLLTDDLGLPMAGHYYAKSKCKTCNGKGYYSTTLPVGAVASTMHSCMCAQKRYAAARDFVLVNNAGYDSIDRSVISDLVIKSCEPLSEETIRLGAQLILDGVK